MMRQAGEKKQQQEAPSRPKHGIFNDECGVYIDYYLACILLCPTSISSMYVFPSFFRPINTVWSQEMAYPADGVWYDKFMCFVPGPIQHIFQWVDVLFCQRYYIDNSRLYKCLNLKSTCKWSNAYTLNGSTRAA